MNAAPKALSKVAKGQWKDEETKNRYAAEDEAHEAEEEAKDALEREALGLGPESDNYGVNRFAEKQAELDLQGEEIDYDAMKKLAGEASAEIREELNNSAKQIMVGLTPGFVQRFLSARVHSETAKGSAAAIDAMEEGVKATMKGAKKAYKKDRKDRKKLKQVLGDRGVMKAGHVAEIEKFKQESVLQQEDNYLERRDAALAEVQAKIDAQQKELMEKEHRELLARRQYNLEHWSKVAKDQHQAAEDNNKSTRQEKTAIYRGQIDRMYDEWGERDLARTRMQVEPAGLSSPIGRPGKELGVFGVPMGDGAYHGRYEDGGHIGGLDDHDVHVFHSDPYVGYEEEAMDLVDDEAEEARVKNLYDSLDTNNNRLTTALKRMVDMRDLAEKDHFQISQEMLLVERSQIGPPRRDPHNHEKEPAHIRKERFFSLTRKIGDYQYCIDMAETEKRQTESQLLEVSQKLATLKEKNKISKDQHDSTNLGMGLLPVVIGRNISKVPGNDLTSKPKELFDAMKQQSKLTETEEMVKYAIKTHVERNQLDQQLWVAKQSGNETKNEANHVISRLADISERMQKQYSQTTKQNIIEALNAFLIRKIPLAPVGNKLAGIIPWWVHRDEHLSKGCIPHKSSSAMGGIIFEIDPEVHDPEMEKIYANGVTLGAHHSGFAVGIIEMPKNAMWSVLATVSLQGSGPEFEHNDETDRLDVSLGGSIGTLQRCLVSYNKINPQTGSVLYDVNFVFRGDSLAYRFDFTSSTRDPKKHMVVSVGLYEEYEVQGMEFRDIPGSSKQSVLTAYVKIRRIDETQGKFRETKLLEELIAIEDSTSIFWDSDIVSKVPQRYSREYFLRILKAEILLEQKSGNAKLMEVLDKRAKIHSKIGKNVNKKDKALESSKSEFMSRKRSKQSHILEAGKTLINKRVEIFDPAQGTWRHVIIKECVVRWLDNGLTARCTHIVHEHNEGQELIGVEFEIDLGKVRWFESAVQTLDEAAMLKWRRQKQYEKRLGEIDSAIEAKVFEFRTAYDKFRTDEETALKKHTDKTMKKLNKNVDKMAEAKAKVYPGSREIKSGVAQALLDMKIGIIEVDTNVKPGEQAQKASYERWINKWVKNKREEVMNSLLQREQQVEERINTRRLEFIELEQQVVKLASNERYSIIAQIREYKAEEKKKMMKRVKFDPKKFKLAVPQAEICEHLNTKCWGNNYGKGVRCKSCGKELSEIHHEENQILGYGSGTSEELYDAVKRHRHDEAAFRFKDSKQLSLVEYERLRIEKERRVMEEEEAFFYDFNDLRVVYNFDRRHAKFIKQGGIFRQGLQWTEEELRQFELDMRYKEIDRLKTDNLVETMIEKFDPLNCIAEPPPTFRGMDEKRKANYDEFMFMMGRLHTYQKKIAYLKEIRLELLSERTVYSIVLEFLHKESYSYDQELDHIERDLDKTGLLLSTFERMQAMWKSANRIMAQAQKDKMKAEMKQCGVWDDVKDALKTASFLHDETLSLLKVKFLFDNQLEGTRKLYQEQQSQFTEKKEQLKSLQNESGKCGYCRPGDLVITRYGDGIIRQYRQRDDMLLISLSFGEPLAKLWIHSTEIVAAERARQQGEVYMMGMEDERTKKFYRIERTNCKKERYAMQKEEEGLKQFYEFNDLGSAQDTVALDAVNKAVRDKYVIMDSANFQKSVKTTVTARLDVVVKKQLADYRNYVGPSAGRPKNASYYWIWNKKKEITSELKRNFLVAAAAKAERDAHENFQIVRSEWIKTYMFSQIIDATVIDMIAETAKETYQEGKMAKKNAERLSGLIFPNPRTMQYDAYRSLVEVWKARKMELRKKIEINQGAAAKAKKKNSQESMSEEEMMKIKAQLRKERIERLRQKALCAKMEAEEAVLKVFYQWELKQNLRERRLMKQEEDAMVRLKKEEEKARLEAEEERRKGYLVSDKLAEEAADAKKRNEKAEGFENRRKQLQDEVQERRRKAEDHAHMILEDEAGKSLREIDVKERTLKKMAKNLGVDVSELQGMGGGDISTELDPDAMFVEIPDWFTALDIPDNWDDLPPVSQQKIVDEKTNIRNRATKIEKNIEISNRMLDKLEDTSYDIWKETYSVVEQDEMEVELQVMNMDETSKQYEHDLQELENNIHRIMIFCREKGEEELRAKAQWKRKIAYARKRDKELLEAQDWHELCQRRAKQRDKIKRKVVENCLWIDTDSITGFHQRFRTELLRERLYWSYFRRILDSIVTRAEIIASERKMMSIQEQLSHNKAVLVERTAQMKERWHDIQRDEYLRMRKSVLNKKFFPNHRRQVLLQRFSSWVRFFLWNRGHREAFELRYELIKRQLDMDRQFKEQLKRRKQNEEKHTEEERRANKKPTMGQTPMARHREHVVGCLDCKAMYIESQNHSTACRYHTAKFSMQCPRDCPAPGMTAKCASHRIRRWTCCDSTRTAAVGCCRKAHTPKPVDTLYDKMMNKLIERDREISVELDKKLVVARTDNWNLQMMQVKRGQVQHLEEGIQVERDQAERFKDLKFH